MINTPTKQNNKNPWPFQLEVTPDPWCQRNRGINMNYQSEINALDEWYTSYILMWLSSEAVINSWESGENVKDLIGMA